MRADTEEMAAAATHGGWLCAVGLRSPFRERVPVLSMFRSAYSEMGSGSAPTQPREVQVRYAAASLKTIRALRILGHATYAACLMSWLAA